MFPKTSSLLREFDLQTGVLRVALNKTQTGNALDPQMAQELADTFNQADKDSAVGAIVFTGEGRHFCTGADLNALRHALDSDANTSEALNWTQTVLTAMEACRVPIIVGVHGNALGAALSLVACSHIRLASADATFGLPEARLGIFPMGPYPYLAELVGRRAFTWALTCETVDATTARESSLIDKIVGSDQLHDESIATAQAIAALPARVRHAAISTHQAQRNDSRLHTVRTLFSEMLIDHIRQIDIPPTQPPKPAAPDRQAHPNPGS